MQFLYPNILWALFTLTIPVIIHLFNFRRYKTVYFSNVAFLKNIRKETKSRSNLKNILILIARLLALAFLVLVFDLNYPLHGFFHSFLGGFIVAVLLSLVMSKIRRYFTPLLTFFKIEQFFSFKKILFSSICAIFLHILLDSPIYSDILPFFPFEFNPFYRSTFMPGLIEYLICAWCFIGAIFVYIIRLFQHKNRKLSPKNF